MIRITFTYNEQEQQISDFKITPNVTSDRYDEAAHARLTAILAGTGVGLLRILSELPILRPVTEREVEQKIYVFKDPDKEMKLYESRKELYYALGSTFNEFLKDLFPDVTYIEGARLTQQELSLERTPEEHDEFMKIVEEITKEVRNG